MRLRGDNPGHLLSMFGAAFGEHKITVQAVNTAGGTIPDLTEIVRNGETEVVNAEFHTAGHLLLFTIIAAYFVYIFGKILKNSKIQIINSVLSLKLTLLSFHQVNSPARS